MPVILAQWSEPRGGKARSSSAAACITPSLGSHQPGLVGRRGRTAGSGHPGKGPSAGLTELEPEGGDPSKTIPQKRLLGSDSSKTTAQRRFQETWTRETGRSIVTPHRIECRRVTKTLTSGRQTLTVLDSIELTIDAGEFVAIVGPSGSGKSTLLGLLAGLDRPSQGSVLLDGTTLEDRSEDELARLRRVKVGFVFQSFHLLGNLTARENVLLPLELIGIEGCRRRADELLGRVGLEDRAHHYPSQLSGGEQQRVALARAFGPRPAILLADEPTGNLDRESGLRALDLLVELREREGTTLVLVTHDPDVAARAERRIVLAGGKIVKDEPNPIPAKTESESEEGVR